MKNFYANPEKKRKALTLAAYGFMISGCLWNLGAVFGGNVGLYIPIGMMNICIGLAFYSYAHRLP